MRNANQPLSFRPIPARAGIGLRAPHYAGVLETKPDVGWFEVHPENYMGAGGPPHRYLTAIRKDYPLSLHGVGLSLGSAGSLDQDHIRRLAELVERYQPGQVSEHVAWTTFEGAYLNDLLPLPYTEDSLAHLIEHIDEVQTALKRRILIENPSSYLTFAESTIPEHEFLVAAARRAGCGILLDVNNVFVSACNHGFDAEAYLAAIPAELVGEIHLAGHSVEELEGMTLRIDDHGSPVMEAVWALYEATIGRLGAVPTLIEWDNNIPALPTLLEEARLADAILARFGTSKDNRHAHAA